jgi:PAS domain S-box-containing protein
MRDEEKTPQQLLQELQSLRQRLAIFERAEAEGSRPQAHSQETEAHLLLLLEQLPVAVWATDPDMRITHSVGAGLAALGLQPHQLVGQTLFQYFQTEDPDFWFIRHTRQALAGESVRLESEWLGRHYQTRFEPLRKENRIIGVVGVAEDITDRKRTEEALQRSEAEFRAMFELAGVGKGQVDPSTRRFLRVNQKMCEITGYTADELYGMTFSDITHPDDRDRDNEILQRHLNGETRDYAVEKRLLIAVGK